MKRDQPDNGVDSAAVVDKAASMKTSVDAAETPTSKEDVDANSNQVEYVPEEIPAESNIPQDLIGKLFWYLLGIETSAFKKKGSISRMQQLLLLGLNVGKCNSQNTK